MRRGQPGTSSRKGLTPLRRRENFKSNEFEIKCPREAANPQPRGKRHQGRASSEVKSRVKSLLLATCWTRSLDGAATSACGVSNSGFSGCTNNQSTVPTAAARAMTTRALPQLPVSFTMKATVTGPATFDAAPHRLVQPDITPVKSRARSCAADQTTTCTKPTAAKDRHRKPMTAAILTAHEARQRARALTRNPTMATGARAAQTD